MLLDPIVARVKDCMRAAALATGCTVEFTSRDKYDDLQNSIGLSDYFTQFYLDTWGSEGDTVGDGTTLASGDFVRIFSILTIRLVGANTCKLSRVMLLTAFLQCIPISIFLI